MDFVGKVAIVTGGAQGVGRSYCNALLDIGMTVCIIDVKENTAKEFIVNLSDDIRNNIIFHKCDITSYTEFKDAFEKVVSTFGRVDVVVNNAAIMTEHEWRKMVEVNFIGVINGIKLGYEYMDINKGGFGGFIVSTASNAGLNSFPLGPVYSGCKHGVIGLTKSYGTDLHLKKTGIKVCAVCPGPIDTDLFHAFPETCIDKKLGAELIAPMNPLKPEEVAKALIRILVDGKNGALLSIDESGLRYVE